MQKSLKVKMSGVYSLRIGPTSAYGQKTKEPFFFPISFSLFNKKIFLGMALPHSWHSLFMFFDYLLVYRQEQNILMQFFLTRLFFCMRLCPDCVPTVSRLCRNARARVRGKGVPSLLSHSLFFWIFPNHLSSFCREQGVDAFFFPRDFFLGFSHDYVRTLVLRSTFL